MPKTVKELIRDRYEKLLERMKLLETSHAIIDSHVIRAIDTLDRIIEILEAGPQPDANFFWPADREKLDVELREFSYTSQEANDFVFKQQAVDMQLAANAFQDYLVAKYDDVELVNFQQARHAYESPDRSSHADALVILYNPANPSEDIVVDFCSGSSEPGTLYGKLQFLVHPERRPYSWWVDNNFPQEEDG